jgi:hypothetical protein
LRQHGAFTVLTTTAGAEMSLIRNNGRRKVYSLELVPVVPFCGLKIEIIEGFRKGLM